MRWNALLKLGPNRSLILVKPRYKGLHEGVKPQNKSPHEVELNLKAQHKGLHEVDLNMKTQIRAHMRWS
jgi:hypothetical protein